MPTQRLLIKKLHGEQINPDGALGQTLLVLEMDEEVPDICNETCNCVLFAWELWTALPNRFCCVGEHVLRARVEKMTQLDNLIVKKVAGIVLDSVGKGF